MHEFDFNSIVGQCDDRDRYESTDWPDWRLCYNGGRPFRDNYLYVYGERETAEDFRRRRSLTPIPAYAKREVNRVRNALFQRFVDIVRKGGTRSWQDAVEGIKGGIDLRGTTMNSYIGKTILPELLVMGRVGVLVDAPEVRGETQADVPAGFRPYLHRYPIEHVPIRIPAPFDSPSDWSAVLVLDIETEANVRDGKCDAVHKYRYYWVDEVTRKVNVQRVTSSGDAIGPTIRTKLDAIPFVMFDIEASLIMDACSHQITLLNMISSDSAYAIDSNFPFLTRQRGNANAGAHLTGEDDNADVGTKKGLFYEKNLDRPEFISPPTGPLEGSLKLRQELKDEVRELVSGQLADLGNDGTIDAGLAFIGACVLLGETRLWDHWTAYESVDPARREVPTVSYPDTWSLKSDEERVADATGLLDLAFKLPGRGSKEEFSILAQNKALRGRVSTERLDELAEEVRQAPYATSDPAIIIPAKEKGIISAETAALALGSLPGEAERAAEDQAKRAAAIVAAQSDDAAARGNPDGSVDPDDSASKEKEQSTADTELGGEDSSGQRGKGLNNGD